LACETGLSIKNASTALQHLLAWQAGIIYQNASSALQHLLVWQAGIYNKMYHQLYSNFWLGRLENITKCIYASSALSTATLGLWGWNV
jgi:hypothetical protein